MNGETGGSQESLVAQGFAYHLVQWSKYRSTPHAAEGRLLHKAASLVSARTVEGHVCVPIDNLADNELALSPRDVLLASGVVGTPDQPMHTPLILDEKDRLYLHRYFDYERRLASRLLQAVGAVDEVSPALIPKLDALFPPSDPNKCDWQKVAVALALRSRLTVISGGPGTGKTTTVVALLACLLEQRSSCKIALAAPTGKAAARMQEAIRKRATDLSPEIATKLPTESYTVHRLLGVTDGGRRFRHDRNNLLPIDVLVIDEASMLDLALATKLFEAVPPNAKIIILGDKDQLAAVEAGTVFADLSGNPTLDDGTRQYLTEITDTKSTMLEVQKARLDTRLTNCAVWLTESHRFKPDSGIGRLAASINANEPETAVAILRDSTYRDIQFIEEQGDDLSEKTKRNLIDAYLPYTESVRKYAGNIAEVFKNLANFQVLCAIKEGKRGVAGINSFLTRNLRQAMADNFDDSVGTVWYPGRPVMILRNDYTLNLFNGDVGITLPDANGKLLVYFPVQGGSFRGISSSRLPEHDTAFAATVHKSQGSEFEEVLLVMPKDHVKVASRELLYTGITRAKSKVHIVASEDFIREGIKSVTVRDSGLAARLMEG